MQTYLEACYNGVKILFLKLTNEGKSLKLLVNH